MNIRKFSASIFYETISVTYVLAVVLNAVRYES